MRGDFTRWTFDPAQDFSSTLMQQGRVQLDSDWNEQQSIHRHLREIGDGGIIGRFGIPKGSPAFALALTAGGADLSIGQGRAFLEGMPVENRAGGATLFDQPFLKSATSTRPGIPRPTTTGRYVAVLEAWDHHVGAEHEPQLRETALGGPDTATRLRTVWQVRLHPAPGPATTCVGLAGWAPGPAGPQGTLAAETPPGGGAGPCVLPPTAGYRSLDNHLYRVEVHRPGQRGGSTPATVKWSRENGSVVTRVTVSGQILTAASLGPDETLGFAPGDWVEIADEWMELAEARGRLLLVRDVDPDASTIEIDASTPVPTVDATRPVLLTRWDQRGAGLADGIAIGTGDLVLEHGLRVRFGNGNFAAGQYWLIPARTSVGGEAGVAQWPRPGGMPALLPPAGPHRRWAPLGLVDWDAATSRFTVLSDCRVFFPPLTNLDATDIGFDNGNCGFPAGATTVQAAIDALCARRISTCTIEGFPGEDLQAKLDATGPGADIRLCLAAGRYELTAPLRIAGKGDVVVQGAGHGTLLIAPKAETALWVANCRSLVLRDCAFEGGVADTGAALANADGLRGAVFAEDCAELQVEACRFRTAGGAARFCFGLSTINPGRNPATVHVSGCSFEVGHRQGGVLVRDATLVRLRDNRFAPWGVVTQVNQRLRWARLTRSVIGRITIVRGTPPPNRAVVLNIGAERVAFTQGAALGRITYDWAGFVNTKLPSRPMTARYAAVWFKQAVQKRLRELGTGGGATTPLERALLAAINAEAPVISDAIVVAGTRAEEVQVEGNAMTSVLRGVSVAPSGQDDKAASPAGRVLMIGNAVELAAVARPERRFGLFVGNARSITIRDNRVNGPSDNNLRRRLEGVRIWGRLGPFAMVCDNHISGASIGIRFVPIGTLPKAPAWVVTRNLAERATDVVSTPSSAIAARVRGIADNWA